MPEPEPAGPDPETHRWGTRVYGELRSLAAGLLDGERRGHTLEPTALVHEAWLRLAGPLGARPADRTLFCALGAVAMRRVLIDHARRRRADKRGGRGRRVTLDAGVAPAEDRAVELLALEEALDRLRALDPRQCRVVELRFFGGLKEREVAEVLGVSTRTVEDDWRAARAWLRRELT